MAAQSPRDAQFHMQPGSIVVDSNDSEKKNYSDLLIHIRPVIYQDNG